MLLKPSINVIKEKADSRYTLVIMAAKRARDLVEGKPALVDAEPNVPLTIAANEIAEGEITYRRPAEPQEGDVLAAAEAAAAAEDAGLDQLLAADA